MAEAYSDRTEELGIALKNAHAAGDTRAAKILTTELQNQLRRNQRSAKIRAAMPPRETGIFEDITSGFGAGAVGVGEMAALGGAALLEEESELAARRAIQNTANFLRPEGGDPESISYKVASGIGSIVGLASIPVAAGMAGAPGAAALGLGALAAAGAGAGEASERARAAGTTEEKRSEATLRGTFIGLLDVAPITRIVKFADLPTLNKLIEKIPPEKVETIGERIYSAGVTGGIEGAQEMASSVLQNLNEREYNAAAEIFGVSDVEEGAIGASAGAILQGFVDLFASRKGGKTVGDVAKEEAAKPDAPLELLEFKPEDPTQLDLTLDTEEAEVIDGGAIRAQVFKGFKKPFDQLTKKQQKTIQNRIVALSPEEFDALERVIEPTTEARPPEVSPDQMSFPGLEPESARYGPQLQGIPAPEGETIAGETLAVTPEGQALTRQETLDRVNQRNRERKIADDMPSSTVRTGRERAEIAQRTQLDLFPTELAVAEQEGRDSTETRAVDTTPARTVTEEDISAAGFATNNTKIRREVLGKDLADPDIRTALTEEANRLKSQKVRRGVNRLLEGVPSEQRDLPTPRKRKPVATRSGTGDAVDLPSVGVPTGRANTVESGPSVGGAVGDAGRGVGQPATGKGRKRSALARKVEGAVERKAAGRKRTTPTMSNIDPETGDAVVEFPADGGVERIRREVSKDPDTGKIEYSYISLDRLDPDFPASTKAPLLLGSTKKAAINKLTAARTPAPKTKVVPETTKTEAKEAVKAPVKKAKVKKVPAKNAAAKLLAAKKQATRKLLTTDAPEGRAKETISTDRLALIRQAQEKKDDVASKQRSFRKDVDALVEQGYSRIEAVKEAKRLDEAGLLFAPSRAEAALDAPLPDTTIAALKNNELRRALLDLANKSGDKMVSRVARNLAKYTGDTKVVYITPKAMGDLVRDPANQGLFDASSNQIYLNSGLADSYVFLHEMTHAATINTLQNASHPLTKELMKIRAAAQKYVALYYGGISKEEIAKRDFPNLPKAEALRRAEIRATQEFVAEAYSNPEFQTALARINPDGSKLSLWQRMLQAALKFIGLGKFAPKTAQSEAQRLTESILAPAAKHRFGPLLASKSDREGVRKVMEDFKEQMPKGSIKAASTKLVDEFNGLFRAQGRQSPALKKAELAFLGVVPNKAVQDIAIGSGIKGAKKFFDAIELQRGDLTIAEQTTKKVLSPLYEWQARQSSETMKAWNNLVYDSTVSEVDPELTLSQAKKKYGKDTITDSSERKIDKYRELRKVYNSATIGADGRQAYSRLRKFYKNQYTQLLDSLQGRIDGLELPEGQRASLKNELYTKMLENVSVDPYFPLTRSGTYWMAVKNPDALSDSAVFAFESAGERTRMLNEYTAKGYDVEVFDPADAKTYDEAPSGSFVAQVMSVLNVQKADKEVKEQVTRLFIESLPESSFAKALVRRKNTEGYDIDALGAARGKAYDLARQTERIKNSNRIRQALDEAINATPEDLKGSALIKEMKDRAEFAVNPPRDGFAQAANRAAFIWTIGFNASSALVNLSQIPLFAYPMLAGKYGYNATRLSLQDAGKVFMGSPMSRTSETLFGDATTPRSVRDTYKKYGAKAALEAVKDKALPSIDNYYTFTRAENGDMIYSVRKDLNLPKGRAEELKNLLPLVELAARRGQLNSSFIADTLNVDQSGRKLNYRDVATNLSALMFHEAEVMNRQVALIASYNLALNKLTGGKEATLAQKRQAAEAAVDITQDINGGATLETGPRYARKGIPRVALMYKNYGIQMYYTMLKTAKQGLDVARDSYAKELRSKGALPAAAKAAADAFRSDAAKQLAGIHLSALFFAGVQGLPLYGAVSMLMDLGDEDYEETTDTMLRRYLNNDALFKGVLSEVTGLDVSQRVKLTDLLIEANRFNSDPSPEETLLYYAGGPAWSVFSRGVTGFEKLRDGNIERGMEDIMPGAVRNAYKALMRYPREGIRTVRGDIIYDDITGGDVLTQLLGFPPVEYTRSIEETSAAKRMESGARQKRSALAKKLYIAKRFGDWERYDEIRKEMDRFNETRAVRDFDPKLRIDDEFIKRSLKRHESTSANMHNGVPLSQNMQGVLGEEGFF